MTHLRGTPIDFDLAVCVADFALPDTAQADLLQSALARSREVRLFVTHGFQAESARLPFGWEQRSRMLTAGLAQEDRARVLVQPVREHDDARRTLRAVDAQVRRTRGSGDGQLLWLLPDALHGLQDDWPQDSTVEPQGDPDAAAAARLGSLYAAGDPGQALGELRGDLAPGTAEALQDWLGTPSFDRLRAEWRKIAGEKAVWARVPWPVTLVTVDVVVRAAGQVLLIRRGRAPGQGLWALPGGFLENGDTLLQSALRELVEETGLALTSRQAGQALRGVLVLDDPRRSQRGRIVTHAHFFDLGAAEPPPVQGGDDAADARWVPIAELASLETQFHDDHFHILDEFLGLTGDP